MSYNAKGLLNIKHGYVCPKCECKDKIFFSMRAKDKVALRCGNCGKRFGVIDKERKIHAIITNGDTIRAMNNYQLSDLFARIMDNCYQAGRSGKCNDECPMYKCCNDQTYDNIEQWLSAEIEEEY